MPRIQRPRTDAQRTHAITKCLEKSQNTLPAAWLITATQQASLVTTAPLWQSARDAAATGLEAQTTATATTVAAFHKLVRLISHFIQVFNFAVERGDALPTARSFYQLPVSHAEVPEINTILEAKDWAQRLQNGETARVAAGGFNMALPAIGQVTAAATACTAAENAQSTAKSAYDELQEAIAAQRPGIDALIKDLWDTIEFNLRSQEPASMRRKAREWGVVYEDDASGAPTPLEIANLTPASATSVTVTYATTGGEGATSEFLQYKLPGEPDFGHDTPLIRPSQTVSNPAFEQALIAFRTKLVNAEGTTYGEPSEVQL